VVELVDGDDDASEFYPFNGVVEVEEDLLAYIDRALTIISLL